MPPFENLRAAAEKNPDPAARAEQLRKLDQTAASLADIDRRIEALKAYQSKPAPFFSLPAFLMGLLIVGAMVFAVFGGVSRGVAVCIVVSAVFFASAGAYLYVRRKARKAAILE